MSPPGSRATLVVEADRSTVSILKRALFRSLVYRSASPLGVALGLAKSNTPLSRMLLMPATLRRPVSVLCTELSDWLTAAVHVQSAPALSAPFKPADTR